MSPACTLAQLDDFLRQLPGGLETMAGEDGVRLSGGQRQRVAIARGLYQDPAVLVFDVATAALDNQTERDLTRAIAALHGERTLIVIAASPYHGAELRPVDLPQGRQDRRRGQVRRSVAGFELQNNGFAVACQVSGIRGTVNWQLKLTTLLTGNR